VQTTLDEFQRRVLGVLMEKAMSQPQYYPMTLNQVVSGCNQKSNRDPVMDLDADTVWKTLNELREMGLVTEVMPAPGSRAEKYRHNVPDKLGWEKRKQAIMAELLIRGPQTVGELRTRCSRMMPFESIDAVVMVLDNLPGGNLHDLPPRDGKRAV